ncbi:hypothetical protein ABT170_40485, partial [Streptomyces sp. NPDC001787]
MGMDEERAQGFPPVHELAEDVLLEWFRREVASDPETAFAAVERLVVTMHEASCPLTEGAVEAGVGWHRIGRAHAALEGAGFLLRQAAALLLGMPAAEGEAIAHALGEELPGDGG